MAVWPLQDAKQQLSRVVDMALQDGPQTITRHGNEVAVVVAADAWRRLTGRSPPSLRDVLLASAGQGDDAEALEAAIPPRGRWRRKPPVFPG
jgi:prevent-host-death family protein